MALRLTASGIVHFPDLLDIFFFAGYNTDSFRTLQLESRETRKIGSELAADLFYFHNRIIVIRHDWDILTFPYRLQNLFHIVGIVNQLTGILNQCHLYIRFFVQNSLDFIQIIEICPNRNQSKHLHTDRCCGIDRRIVDQNSVTCFRSCRQSVTDRTGP